MADDYVAMQTRIADELVNESITTAQIKLAIQSAIKFYERERYYFNESRSQTFSTVASQEFYTSSDLSYIPNIIRIDNLTITVNGNRYPLVRQEWDWIDRISVTTTSIGQPTDYCYYNQQIRLYPIPDAVYTIRVSGLLRLTTLSADADTNAWMTDGEELIRARAKWDLAMNVIWASDIAASCAEVASVAKAALDKETVRRLSSRISGYF